ncbi:TPA: hypothetical protein ACH3X1_004864 [Trebouxia sp. C0004]
MCVLLSSQWLMALLWIRQQSTIGMAGDLGDVGDCLHGHLGQQQLFHNSDIASVVERAKHQHAFEYFVVVQHSSLMLYRTNCIEYSLSSNLLSICLLSSVRQIED